MSQKDTIKDVFADKLGAYETPVNPELWNAIASQIGTSSAVASTGVSLLTKAIIGISAASVIAVATYFGVTSSSNPSKEISRKETQKTPTEEVQNNMATVEESVQLQEKTPDVNASSQESKVVSTVLRNEKVAGKLETPPSNMEEVAIQPPFTNQPTQILTGKKPVEMHPAPKAETSKSENVKIQPNSKKSETPSVQPSKVDKQELKASFEITNLPNVYVANASGYFSIDSQGEATDFLFTLMDESNKVVFSSTDPNFQWRGMDKFGDSVPVGNYVYIITAKDKNGIAVNKYSRLTIMNQ